MTDKPLLSSLHLPEDIPGLSLSLKQELAQELQVYQNAVHKRKKRILRDLKKALNGEVVKTKND